MVERQRQTSTSHTTSVASRSVFSEPCGIPLLRRTGYCPLRSDGSCRRLTGTAEHPLGGITSSPKYLPRRKYTMTTILYIDRSIYASIAFYCISSVGYAYFIEFSRLGLNHKTWPLFDRYSGTCLAVSENSMHRQYRINGSRCTNPAPRGDFPGNHGKVRRLT